MKFIPVPILFSVKRNRVLIAPVQLFCVLLCLVKKAVTFNIDTKFPYIVSDPLSSSNNQNAESYFGYTVQFLFGQSHPTHKSWLLVGAPKSNSSYAEHSSLIEPGVLYSCPFSRTFTSEKCSQIVVQRRASESNTDAGKSFKGVRDSSWLGGSLSAKNASSGRIGVCAHRWTNSFWDSMNGACYWSDHVLNAKEDFNPLRPLVQSELQLTSDKLRFNYGRGQAGFSVHMTHSNGSDEMIIGAPGVYDWTGSVIRVRDADHNIDNPIPTRRRRAVGVIPFGKTVVADVKRLKQLQPYDYFGYSVYSGRFVRKDTLSYVAGAPRGADMKGKVLVFEFVNDSQSTRILRELTGTQLGEYYGAAVLAASFNMDDLDELLVGAPQHSLTSDGFLSSGDEGRVYVYLNKNGNLAETRSLYGNKVRGARFGSTIVLLGDINRDNFNDVAIGAPYENDRGAVYIYLGGRDGLDYHPVTGYWQRISPSDFPSLPVSLRGFGISITTGDLLQNGYPDLAIGSYLSGHAVILRTKPIVKFGYTMMPQNNDRWKIAPHEKIDIKACLSYSFPNAKPNRNFSVYYELFVDAEYINNPRLYLETNGVKDYRQPFGFTETFVRPDWPTCRNFIIGVVDSTYKDLSKPAKFRLAAKLIDGGTAKGFCADCPVADEKQSKFYENTMSLTTDCGADDICIEDLELEAHFLVTSFVIGSEKRLKFSVTVKNNGESSYLTSIDMRLPAGTTLEAESGSNPCKQSSAGLIGEFIYMCMLRTNPLETGKSEIMKYFLDVSAIPSGLDNLTIVVEARVKTILARGQSVLNVTLPLKTEIDLEVLGSPPLEQRPYQLVNGTRNATQDRLPLEHGYEIRNILSSPADEVVVEILFPVSLRSEQGPPVALFESEFTEQNIKATQKGSANRVVCNVSSVLQPNDRKLRDMAESIRTSLAHPREPVYNVSHRAAAIDCYNSNNVECVMITCTARSVIKGGEVAISVSNAMLLQNTIDYFSTHDDFIISSVAFVSVAKPTLQHPNLKPDLAVVSTHVLPQGPPAQPAVASWIVALSVLAGIALLCLAAYGLYKIGFFKRQKIPQEDSMHDGNAGDAAGEIDPDRQAVI